MNNKHIIIIICALVGAAVLGRLLLPGLYPAESSAAPVAQAAFTPDTEPPTELDRKIKASFQASNLRTLELIGILEQVSDKASADEAADRIRAWRDACDADMASHGLDYVAVKDNRTYIKNVPMADAYEKLARRKAFELWNERCYGSSDLMDFIRTFYTPNETNNPGGYVE